MAVKPENETVLKIRRSLHDLAQPLTAVTGLVDLLLLEMTEDDPRVSEVLSISEQLEKVLQIVGEIRYLARRTAATEPGHPDPPVCPESRRLSDN